MKKSEHVHFVVCVDSTGSEDLQVRRLYQLLPDPLAEKNGMVRVIDDSGEDYLYARGQFVDLALPEAIEQTLASTL